MKRRIVCSGIALTFAACQSAGPLDQVVSQTFVHKYGFETSAEDWTARDQDGQIVSTLGNGVKVARSFQNGKLHGLTTYTFPHSTTVEKQQLYDDGILLKEQLNDVNGMPIREEMYEFDNRIIVTLWDDKGVPLSVEEYDDEILVEAKYYTPDHDLEASVTAGSGERVKRDRSGLLISRDEMEDGVMICRSTYHPNGNIHTISHYDQYQLHGTQTKFTASGKPLMDLTWNHNVLDGPKVIYRNGEKIAIIPYVLGKKHGKELHFDDLGFMTAEIEWRDDHRHGPTNLYSEDATETEWFFNGQSVSADRFKMLNDREHIIADFHHNSVE